MRTSIEDIELGCRLRDAGHKILLDKGLQGTHLKNWTLLSMIRTDLSRRALPWSRLILERNTAPDDLNLKSVQRISAILVALAAAFFVLAAFRIELLALSILAYLGVILANRDLYRFFLRHRGVGFVVPCIPLHLIYYLCAGSGFVYAWITFQIKLLAARRQKAVEISCRRGRTG